MAEVVRCEKGHYYDKLAFTECPHCKAGTGEVTGTTGYRKEIARYAMEYLQEQLRKKKLPQTDPAAETGSLGQISAQGDDSDTNGKETASHGNHSDAEARKNGSREGLSNVRRDKQVSAGDLSDAAGRDDRSGRAGTDSGKDGKTIGFSSVSQKNYMVTGWLVCVDGPHTGYSFNLYYGYNTIGYSRNNRVCLLEDVSVARKIHCSVIYEDRKNCFYLVPEENQETYLNEQLLTKVAGLRTGDRIRLGETQLIFIAFCDGERKWDKKLMRKAAEC